MAVRYTPGPWYLGAEGVVSVTQNGAEWPVKIPAGWREDAWRGDGADEESRANAQLIAALPDIVADAERVFATEKMLSPTSRAHCGELLRAIRALRETVTTATQGAT